MTTRTAQRRILEAATRDGSLHTLYWYVCGRQRNVAYAVAAPGAHVPVVAVGSDPEESRHWAHLLLEFVRSANPGLDVTLDLTAADLLAGHAWYEFGSRADWDTVCEACGSVRPAYVDHCDLCPAEPGLIRRIDE